jgi:hypothetical protein
MSVAERDAIGAWPATIVFRNGERVTLAAFAIDDVWQFAGDHGLGRDAVVFTGEALRQLQLAADQT